MVFGTNPAFPAAPAGKNKQAERFKAIKTARDEMTVSTAENRINGALRRKLPPSTGYLIEAGDRLHVYRETFKAGDGTFRITQVNPKLITFTDGTKCKTFHIAQVLPNRAQNGD